MIFEVSGFLLVMIFGIKDDIIVVNDVVMVLDY